MAVLLSPVVSAQFQGVAIVADVVFQNMMACQVFRLLRLKILCDDDTASIVAPSLSETPGQNKRVTKEEDRKAVIESHPHADEVQPHQVFCSGCDQWIRLSTETRYSLYPWRLHLQRCTGTA